MEQERKWIKSARRGDADAFGKLYEQVYEDLYRFALYTMRDVQDAEDVVSEAVISAFSGIKTLRKEEAFKGWIFRILYFKCQDRLRDKIRRREREMSMVNQPPDGLEQEMEIADNGADLEQGVIARGLLFSLPQEERLIISLHIFAGYKSQEIAEMLHMNAATVRSKESRALAKLRKEGGLA